MVIEVDHREELPEAILETPYQTVERNLTRIVREKGENYVYPHAVDLEDEARHVQLCFYTEEEADQIYPSCLLGHLLVDLGMDIDILHEFNTDAISHLCTSVPELLPDSVIEDPLLPQALQAAQDVQDWGGSWGTALKKFKAVYAGKTKKINR